MDEIDFKEFLNILIAARLEAIVHHEFYKIVDQVCEHSPGTCIFCLHKKEKV